MRFVFLLYSELINLGLLIDKSIRQINVIYRDNLPLLINR